MSVGCYGAMNPQSDQEQKEIRISVVNLLRHNDDTENWNGNDRRLASVLRRYKPELVEAMIPAIKRMDEIDARNRDIHALRAFIGLVYAQEPGPVEDLISYGHLISGHLRMFEVTELMNKIRELDYTSGKDAFMPHAEAHILAAGEYDGFGIPSVHHYWDNVPLMTLVNSHPEHASSLVSYWKRGTGISDATEIEEYLSSGNVKDGWL